MARAELAERELEEHAGLAEAGGRLEEHERVFFEGGGEPGPGGFLAGAQRGEGRTETQAAEPRAGAEAQVQELGDALELCAEKGIIGRREWNGLGESAGGFDEDEFRPQAERAIGASFQR